MFYTDFIAENNSIFDLFHIILIVLHYKFALNHAHRYEKIKKRQELQNGPALLSTKL